MYSPLHVVFVSIGSIRFFEIGRLDFVDGHHVRQRRHGNAYFIRHCHFGIRLGALRRFNSRDIGCVGSVGDISLIGVPGIGMGRRIRVGRMTGMAGVIAVVGMRGGRGYMAGMRLVTAMAAVRISRR